jgi:hypothetical protein
VHAHRPPVHGGARAPQTPRPTFLIELRPQPGVDAVRALRMALKVLLRRFGLKAVKVEIKDRGPAR